MVSSLHRPSLSSRAPAPRAGFTLLEILLAISLIALVGTVLISVGSHLITDQPVTPDEVFWKSVQEARKIALKREQEVRLRFNKEKKRFLIIDGTVPPALAADGFTREEVPLKEFPVVVKNPTGGMASELNVEFLPSGTKSGNLILVGGVALESNPVPFVTFYPDGTCTAFRAQVFVNGSAHVLSVDPWTCAAVLPPPDPNAFPR